MAPVPSMVLTETATPFPTATLTLTPTLTATVTSTPTLIPTLEGGGAGKILFEAYFSDEMGNVVPRIYTYDFASNLSQLLFEGYFLRDISPVGDKVLLAKGANLYLASLDGAEVILLRNDTAGWQAKWLIGSEDILFIKEIDGLNQVFLLDPMGEIQQLTYSSVGVLSYNSVLFGRSLLWEEGYANSNGANTYGWRLTNLDTLDSGEEIESGFIDPVVSIDGNHLARIIVDEFTFIPHALRIINVQGDIVYEAAVADIIDPSLSAPSYFISGLELTNMKGEFVISIDDLYSTQSGTRQYIVSINDDSVRVINTSLQPLAWSPDGTQFIGASCSRSDDNGGVWRIFKSDFFENETELLMDQEIISNIRFSVSEMVWLP